jgi:hypothetical protein
MDISVIDLMCNFQIEFSTCRGLIVLAVYIAENAMFAPPALSQDSHGLYMRILEME